MNKEFGGYKMEGSPSLENMKNMLADAIYNVFMAHINEEKLEGGTPWQIYLEKDSRYRMEESVRLRMGNILPEDPDYDEVIRQYNLQIGKSNSIFYNKIRLAIESSLNKSIIYWSGEENAIPEFYFTSSAYKGIDTLYLFKPMPQQKNILFNSVRIMPDNQVAFSNVKNEEAKVILIEFFGRDMDFYE
jgi:hypothetical protein